MRAEIATANFLELRKDEIIMQQAMTMRQLAAAPSQSPQDAPETVEEEPERAEPRPVTVESQESVQRPWWRRVFGR